jgi:site-specific DNA-methyltransferase (adenine-specific)
VDVSGDYSELQAGEIMLDLRNCDCMDMMKEFPDKYFDLAIVDPPYGININVSIGRRKGDKKSNYHKFAGGDKEIPKKEYFVELFRVSKNIICFGGNYFTEFFPPSSCWILWDKGFSEDVSFAQFEMAWTSFKTSAKKFDKSSANKDRIHPTEKPVALYRWLLKNYAKEGDKILDTHLGSGSIAIACHQMGFDLTASELDKDYFDAMKKRVDAEISQEILFELK